jgi:hypothetical protein
MYKVHLYKYNDTIIYIVEQECIGQTAMVVRMIANKYKIYNTVIEFEEIKKIYDITHLKIDGSVDYIKNDDMCFPCKTIIKKHSYMETRRKLDTNINITTPEGIKFNFTYTGRTKRMK